jgi:hypothetical protein
LFSNRVPGYVKVVKQEPLNHGTCYSRIDEETSLGTLFESGVRVSILLPLRSKADFLEGMIRVLQMSFDASTGFLEKSMIGSMKPSI